MKKQLLAVVLSSTLIAGGVTVLPEQVAASSDQVALAAMSGKVVRSVSFRTAPTTSSKVNRYLKKGEKFTILDKPNSYWFKIRDQKGKIGYVSSLSKYVATNYKEPAVRPVSASEAAKKVIAAGKKYLGTPYEFGSSRANTKTFDCSDFVRQAYIDGIGLKLPADSRSQGAYVKKKGNIKTDWRQLKPGDIMFFMEYKGSKASNYQGVDKLSERITHNGIYIGDGKILQTYSVKSGGVRIDTIAGSQWEKRFLFGGSPL